MWNLLKVMNKQIYLKNLNSIDEIYDLNATFTEEIEYYHNHKKKFDEIQNEKFKEKELLNITNSSNMESEISFMKIN